MRIVFIFSLLFFLEAKKFDEPASGRRFSIKIREIQPQRLIPPSHENPANFFLFFKKFDFKISF